MTRPVLPAVVGGTLALSLGLSWCRTCQAPAEADLQTALREALAAPGQTVSRVAKILAKQFNLPRRQVYDQALKMKGKRS